MVRGPLGLSLAEPLGAHGGGAFGLCPLPLRQCHPLSPHPSHRRSLQQVLLLCTGIVVMVLFSIFIE